MASQSAGKTLTNSWDYALTSPIFHAPATNCCKSPRGHKITPKKFFRFSGQFVLSCTPPLLPRCSLNSSLTLRSPFEKYCSAAADSPTLHANFYKRQNYYQNDSKSFEYVYYMVELYSLVKFCVVYALLENYLQSLEIEKKDQL